MKSYDGYLEILKEVRSIIKAEPICEEHKDSLLTKIEHLEDVIGEMLSGREEQAFQERRK